MSQPPTVDLDPNVSHESQEGDSVTPTAAVPEGGFLCTKCGAANKKNSMEICRTCGYYARLGTYVELEEWDREQDGDAETEEGSPSHVEVWRELLPTILPGWVCLILLSVVLVVAESLAGRFLTPEEGSVRMIWSLSQLAIGLTLFLGAHVYVYVRSIMDDGSANLLDVILRPITCWKPSFNALPRTKWLFAAAAAGITAVVMSLAVIRAIPYERLWDWGVEPPPSQNLMKAIVQQARQAQGGDKSLEEAVQDFAGEEEETAQETAATPRVPVDCVILGYTKPARENDGFGALVLGTVVNGQLKLCGYVSTGIAPETRAVLFEKMQTLRRATPFVPSRLEATWVEPILACRILCERQTSRGRLVSPRFEKLLPVLSY